MGQNAGDASRFVSEPFSRRQSPAREQGLEIKKGRLFFAGMNG
jgi:hypothetical protein